MEQSQLVELIKTLSPDEKQLILQLAEAPFFLRSKIKRHVISLLGICFQQSWGGEQITKEDIFFDIFKADKSYAESKLEKVMVEANKAIRKGLIVSYYLREENLERVREFNLV